MDERGLGISGSSVGEIQAGEGLRGKKKRCGGRSAVMRGAQSWWRSRFAFSCAYPTVANLFAPFAAMCLS